TNQKNGKHRLHHPVVAVGIKEWYAIKRDVREWFVFMPLIFIIVFPLVGFFSSGAELSEMRGFSRISWPIAQGILLFIYAIVNGQVAAFSVAREGKSMWLLRSLPLSGRDIALGKLWISWSIPFVMLTGIEIIVGLLLGWGPLSFIIGIGSKAVIT